MSWKRRFGKILGAVLSIGAVIAGAVFGGPAAAALGLTAMFGATAGAAIAGTLIATAISIGGGALLGLNKPQDVAASLGTSYAAQSREILGNKTGTSAPIPVIYGTRRVGGTVVYMATTGASNQHLHFILALCEGTISAINTVYLDDKASTSARFSGHVRINKHLGSDGQTADADAVAELSGWTTDHRLRGVAYLYVRLTYNQDAFTAIPTITADVDGRTLYDPRSATTAHSHNPVLAIRDYLTNTRYGRGIPSAMIDDTFNAAEADFCDQSVTIAGASVTRYTCDGVVDTSQTSMAIMEKMLSACRGMLVFTAGKYRVVIDRERTPSSFAFTEANIVGAWQIALGDKRNTFNRIRADFFNPATNWQPDIAVVDSTVLRALDNGLLLEREIELPFTAHAGRAAMIAAICLNQSRQQITATFTATIAGLRCEVGDVVPITHTTPGWAAKNFLILGIGLKNNDEVTVTAREYDATVYDYGTIAAANTAPDTTLPDPFSVSPPTNLTVAESLYVTRDGAGVKCQVALAWTAAAETFVTHYQVEYKLDSAATWTVAGSTTAAAITLFDFDPARYGFRVKTVNTFGVSSAWCQHTQEIFALTATPADISNLSLQVINNQAHLSWNQSADVDVRIGGKIRIRHSAAGSPSWSSALDIGPAVPGSATSVVLPALSGTYLVKAVDSTGKESATAATVTTSVPNIVTMNAVATSTQPTAFAGAKTGMAAVDNVLKLNGSVDIDDIFDDIDDLDDWDGAGGLEVSGVYEFDAAVDLGAVHTSRVTAAIEALCYEITDLIDSRAGNVDDYKDWDDNAFSDIVLALYVATTDDDPAGAPSWSAWRQFVVGDYTCRGYKFKLTVATGATTHQVAVSALAVTVDVPDRVQSAHGVTVPVTGLAVSYAAGFYATPALGITIQDAATGDYPVISGAGASGFSVTIRNAAGAAVERQIDYMAKGY